MTNAGQLSLFANAPEVEAVVAVVRDVLAGRAQPSAWELLTALDCELGIKARWAVRDDMQRLVNDALTTNSQKAYLRDLLNSDDWKNALSGGERPAREVESTIAHI